MVKKKIAISLDEQLLKQIDLKIDKNIIRSRSQAIELFLKKGLKETGIDTAILMVSKKNQKSLLKIFQSITLLENQVIQFKKHGISNVFILTQHSIIINELILEIQRLSGRGINIDIYQTQATNNGLALKEFYNHNKNSISENLIVMNGNIYLEFDLQNMIKRHINEDKLATIGLRSSKQTSRYGIAVLEGEMVIDFDEKPKISKSNIVNSGIYIFKKQAIELIDNSQLELDLLPKLAKIKQLLGYFTMGNYQYINSNSH